MRHTHVVFYAYLPVAQLDRATDSDSVGRRFESCRVGQTDSPPFWRGLSVCHSSEENLHLSPESHGGKYAACCREKRKKEKEKRQVARELVRVGFRILSGRP